MKVTMHMLYIEGATSSIIIITPRYTIREVRRQPIFNILLYCLLSELFPTPQCPVLHAPRAVVWEFIRLQTKLPAGQDRGQDVIFPVIEARVVV